MFKKERGSCHSFIWLCIEKSCFLSWSKSLQLHCFWRKNTNLTNRYDNKRSSYGSPCCILIGIHDYSTSQHSLTNQVCPSLWLCPPETPATVLKPSEELSWMTMVTVLPPSQVLFLKCLLWNQHELKIPEASQDQHLAKPLTEVGSHTLACKGEGCPYNFFLPVGCVHIEGACTKAVGPHFPKQTENHFTFKLEAEICILVSL